MWGTISKGAGIAAAYHTITTASMIYLATYLGVPVYELPLPTGLVMRRVKDGWINATHILKTASFPKARRTRILERDVQTGVHEKVQGGYGKYQGTWVPPERGREIALQFGVDLVLQPIFDYVYQEHNPPPPAPKHLHAPRTATAAKKMPLVPGKRGRPPSAAKRAATFSGGEVRLEPVRANGASHSFLGVAPVVAAPPASIARLPSNSSESLFLLDDSLSLALRLPGTFTPHQPVAPGYLLLLPNAAYTQRLLEYFVLPELLEDRPLPDVIARPPVEFNPDQAIDLEGNTPFHWACAMGNTRVCELLLSVGASMRRCNNLGQVPIMRAVCFTNASTLRSFARLCEMLRETVFDVDTGGSTVLHIAAATALDLLRVPAAKYYLETVLAKVAEWLPERLAGFVNQTDNSGMTAVAVAQSTGARRCVAVLRSYGATPTPTELELQPAASYFPTPRFSEVGIRTAQTAPRLIEQLNMLADAFDTEAQLRDAELAELQQALARMQEELRTPAEIGAKLATTTAQLLQAREEYAARAQALVRTLERNQARDVARLVHREEAGASIGPPRKVEQAVVELTSLQVARRNLLSEVVELHAEGSGSAERMDKYRRLVSVAIGVPKADVDGMLEGIEESIGESVGG